jgi:hypothetical protein
LVWRNHGELRKTLPRINTDETDKAENENPETRRKRRRIVLAIGVLKLVYPAEVYLSG